MKWLNDQEFLSCSIDGALLKWELGRETPSLVCMDAHDGEGLYCLDVMPASRGETGGLLLTGAATRIG